MMDPFSMRWKRRLAFFFLPGFFVSFLFAAVNRGVAREDPLLTSKDLIEIRSIILSGSVEYESRVKLAKTAAVFLEKRNRSTEARRMVLAFYSSITLLLERDHASPQVLEKPMEEYIKAIDRGKRGTAVSAYQSRLSQQDPQSPSRPYALIALKADDMMTAYAAFFADIEDKAVSAYSDYLLGILLAREKRFVEAERLLESVRDDLASQRLENWLRIDLVKIALVLENVDKAENLVKQQLQANPKDPRFMNLWIYCLLKQGRKDIARQELAKVIPLLYEEPYLVAETAELAMQLDELDKAAAVLASFEKKVEANHDFYKTYALVCKARGQTDQAEAYAQKAAQIQNARVNVSQNGLPADVPLAELRQVVREQREKRREEIASIEVASVLDRVYLYLLTKDAPSAVEELKKFIGNQTNHTHAQYILAAIQRRGGALNEAIDTLKTLRQARPKFRAYDVLSLLADYCVRTNKIAQAKEYYRQLDKEFPDSYQAEVARAYLGAEKQTSDEMIYPVKASSFMSRYEPYAPPFLIAEIMNYWGDRVKFSRINNLLGTSPRRALNFEEFLTALITIPPQYNVLPLVGNARAVRTMLLQKIPVVFCQGGMFSSQKLSHLTLIVGTDPLRNVFYAEGVTPSAQHIYTEKELKEGICFAVSPSTLKPELEGTVKEAAQEGRRFVDLNMSVLSSQREANFNLAEFNAQKTMVHNQDNPLSIPHHLGFIRWEIRNSPIDEAKQYIEDLKPICGQLGMYWFLYADADFQHTKSDHALTFLNQAIARDPREIRYQLASVRALNKIGKTNESIVLAEQLREQYPEDPSISAHLVALYKKAGAKELEKVEELRLKNLLHIEEIDINIEGEEDGAE